MEVEEGARKMRNFITVSLFSCMFCFHLGMGKGAWNLAGGRTDGELEMRGLFFSLSDGGDRCLQPPVS